MWFGRQVMIGIMGGNKSLQRYHLVSIFFRPCLYLSTKLVSKIKTAHQVMTQPWPFYPSVGGHISSRLKGHVFTIPKKVTKDLHDTYAEVAIATYGIRIDQEPYHSKRGSRDLNLHIQGIQNKKMLRNPTISSPANPGVVGFFGAWGRSSQRAMVKPEVAVGIGRTFGCSMFIRQIVVVSRLSGF